MQITSFKSQEIDLEVTPEMEWIRFNPYFNYGYSIRSFELLPSPVYRMQWAKKNLFYNVAEEHSCIGLLTINITS